MASVFLRGVVGALCLLAAGLVAPAGGGQGERVVVSAASSLMDVLDELAGLYAATGAGVRIDLNIAGSNTLARQIVEGAQVDLFLSANVEEMRRVAAAARLGPQGWTNLLSNQLVVVSPSDVAVPLRSLDDLRATRVRRIAIGDPLAVPAGIYARRYLEAQGAWTDLAGKLVTTRSVRAALAAAEAGNVDAAFVYRTDAATAASVDIAYAIPTELTPAIIYPAAVIAGGPNPAGADRFLRFLRGTVAAGVFERAGFSVLAAPPEAAR